MAGINGMLEVLGNIIMNDRTANNSKPAPVITLKRASFVARIRKANINITDATAIATMIATMIAIKKSLGDCILRSVSIFS